MKHGEKTTDEITLEIPGECLARLHALARERANGADVSVDDLKKIIIEAIDVFL